MVLMMIMVQQMKIMILLFIKNDMLFIDKTTGRGWEISPSVVLGAACGGGDYLCRRGRGAER